MSQSRDVAVIIPTYNEASFIGIMLESLISQDIGNDRLEVYIVDGRSEDDTRSVVESFAQTHPWITLLDNPHRIVPYAMNIGIENSTGKYIVRMDAHSEYPEDYISTLIAHLETSSASNVGGAWHTVAGAESNVAEAIALATSHPFGIGNAQYRLESEEIRAVDTVPYGCYPREVLERIGYYDEDLVRNQDDELNGRLIAAGGEIHLIPSLRIKYSARPTWRKMMKMFYQYGLFKPLVNKKLGHAATLRQVIPPLFVIGLFSGLILSIVLPAFSWLFGLLTLLYGLSALYFSLKIASKEKNWLLLLMLPITFFLVHLSYGLGYLEGLIRFRILNSKGKRTKSSR